MSFAKEVLNSINAKLATGGNSISDFTPTMWRMIRVNMSIIVALSGRKQSEILKGINADRPGKEITDTYLGRQLSFAADNLEILFEITHFCGFSAYTLFVDDLRAKIKLASEEHLEKLSNLISSDETGEHSILCLVNCCPNCNFDNRKHFEQAKFCANCGRQLSVRQQSTKTLTPVAPEMFVILNQTIDNSMELSVRSANCLQNNNIRYVGELVRMSEINVLKIKNFGRKSLKEIKDALAERGLTIGMDVGNWQPPT